MLFQYLQNGCIQVVWLFSRGRS